MAGVELTEIKDFIGQNTRNKIVICREVIGGLHFINVGYDLSLLLSKNSYNYEETVSVIFDKTLYNETIGNYLALTNFAILIEPELKVNIHNILDAYSRNQCLIIQSDIDFHQWINLDGLTYKQL
ncbi:MAG: hypothetical protein IKP48_08940 [Bacteroidaceae bacterium]|nr:hypothetical protein [Bacteroidaceae bacterium]